MTTLSTFIAVAIASATLTAGAYLPSTPITVSPLTGLVLWDSSRANKAYKDSIALQFAYFGYSDVVTGYDTDTMVATYDWTPLDTMLDTFKANGNAAIIRFRDQNPHEDPTAAGPDGMQYVNTFVPAAVKAAPGYSESQQGWCADDDIDQQSATIMYKFPDWSSQHLRNFYQTFFTDLAARYDNDTRLGFLQFGYGNWGEYHIYPYTYDVGVNFPSEAFQVTMLQLLGKVFINTPFMLSIDAASSSGTNLLTDATALGTRYGLMDDSFMHANHDSYNEPSFNQLNSATNATRRWDIAPVGGEISYYTSTDQKNFLDAGGMYGRTWAEQAAKFRVTYMLANDAPTAAKNTPEVIRNGSLAAGYKLQIVAVNITRPDAAQPMCRVTVQVNNSGVAAIYHSMHLSVNGVENSTASLRYLGPSITRDIAFSVPLPTNGSVSLVFTSPKVHSAVTIPYTANVTYTVPPMMGNGSSPQASSLNTSTRRGLYVQIYTQKVGQLYVDSPANRTRYLFILDNTSRQTDLIAFLNKYAYTAISLYNMWAVLGSTDLTAKFRLFMRRLRAEVPTLVHVEGISDETMAMWQRFATYQNNSLASAVASGDEEAYKEMLDGYVTEIEFWNGGASVSDLLGCLTAMQDVHRPAQRRVVVDGAPLTVTPHYIVYIGTNVRNDDWVGQLVNSTRVDAYLLAAYVTDPSAAANPIIGSGRTLGRLVAAGAKIGRRQQIGIILSAEGQAYAAGSEYFMGEWLQSYHSSSIASPINASEAIVRTALQSTAAVVNTTLVGFQWYEYIFVGLYLEPDAATAVTTTTQAIPTTSIIASSTTSTITTASAPATTPLAPTTSPVATTSSTMPTTSASAIEPTTDTATPSSTPLSTTSKPATTTADPTGVTTTNSDKIDDGGAAANDDSSLSGGELIAAIVAPIAVVAVVIIAGITSYVVCVKRSSVVSYDAYCSQQQWEGFDENSGSAIMMAEHPTNLV